MLFFNIQKLCAGAHNIFRQRIISCFDRKNAAAGRDRSVGYKKPQLASEAGVRWSGGGDGCPSNECEDTPSVLTGANYKLVITIDKASQRFTQSQGHTFRTRHDIDHGFRKMRSRGWSVGPAVRGRVDAGERSRCERWEPFCSTNDYHDRPGGCCGRFCERSNGAEQSGILR